MRNLSAIFIGNSFFYYNNSMHTHFINFVKAADAEARKLKDEFISAEHLLLGLMVEGGAPLKAIFKTHKVTHDALLKALAHVQSVVERRNTIPILANVLLDAQKPRLSLAATDMDIAILENVPADVAKGGTITVPGDKSISHRALMLGGLAVGVPTPTPSTFR